MSKSREELTTEIHLQMLEELSKLNQVSPVIDKHELKREEYRKLMINKPGSGFGYNKEWIVIGVSGSRSILR